MAGKSPMKASAEQRAVLEVLAASRERGEADRARAVLLTLNGWTSAPAETHAKRASGRERHGSRRVKAAVAKAQAEAGDTVLLYADESEALTHPYLARAWARRGADLRVPAPGQTKKVAMMGALDWAKRKLIVATSRTKRSADFIALLEALDRSHGPKPGFKTKPAVIVLDNGPIHTSKAALAALAARSHWLAVEWLPKYAPELNEIENVWRDLKTNHLAHQTFTDADALDAAIRDAVVALNIERAPHPLGELRIPA